MLGNRLVFTKENRIRINMRTITLSVDIPFYFGIPSPKLDLNLPSPPENTATLLIGAVPLFQI